MTDPPASTARSGLRIRVRGQVQGVGFRPFIWQLAQRYGVMGEVLNDPDGVLIHAFGASEAFLAAIRRDAPPLARVDAVETASYRFDAAPKTFAIAASDGAGARTRVTPDAATCARCLAEIRDPADRRAGYAFANCTHCGPRFSILDRLPYDRAQTSMATFEMCDACRAEYEDPGDRRFHAQPIACPDCGPQLWLEVSGEVQTGDPIVAAARRLKAGEVLAIKGIGGFHLSCDATNTAAVARLRARKHRPSKPLALMAPLEIVERYARITGPERARLTSSAAPIVLLDRTGAALPGIVAPGQTRLGWMLPYTPLHHLLLDAVNRPLVMTSGNLSGEPQVIANADARAKLTWFADAMLMHDRDIRRRLDDSVERETRHGPMILRRGRGRVPDTLPLPPGFEDAPDVLALGAQMKGAICLTKPGQALVSHHLGNLEDRLSYEAFRKAVADYTDLFDHASALIACDLHPGYRASRFARAHAEAGDLPVIKVQHHHAHLAACLGENLWPLDGGQVAGIVLDGMGLGTDGTIWGGELLLGDYAGFTRRGYLRPVPLPGGDKAAREPWRNLLAQLDAAGLSELADDLLPEAPRGVLRQAATQGVNSPLSSSAGRLFDAFSAALGLVEAAQSFEGEAAMTLEGMAAGAEPSGTDPYPFADAGPVLDPTPLWQAWRLDQQTGAPKSNMALRFHAGVAQAFAGKARHLVEIGEAQAVALTGGCFQNALLLDLTIKALGDTPVLIHRRLPANDGGLPLGQALIAAARQMRRG